MKERKSFFKGYALGIISGVFTTLLALFAAVSSARSIRGEDMTAAVWIFVAIGAVIVILQLIPALMLFFSFFAAKNKKDKTNGDEE